ncbi:uncharacterized protein LOC136033562 isoform X2 [Artemia franciscana]
MTEDEDPNTGVVESPVEVVEVEVDNLDKMPPLIPLICHFDKDATTNSCTISTFTLCSTSIPPLPPPVIPISSKSVDVAAESQFTVPEGENSSFQSAERSSVSASLLNKGIDQIKVKAEPGISNFTYQRRSDQLKQKYFSGVEVITIYDSDGELPTPSSLEEESESIVSVLHNSLSDVSYQSDEELQRCENDNSDDEEPTPNCADKDPSKSSTSGWTSHCLVRERAEHVFSVQVKVAPEMYHIFTTMGACTFILRWNPNWFEEVKYISEFPTFLIPESNFPYQFLPVPVHFYDINHYLSVFGPPLIVETFHRVRSEYNRFNGNPDTCHRFVFNSDGSGIVEYDKQHLIFCLHTILPRGSSLFEYMKNGSLVIMQIPLKRLNAAAGENPYFRLLGCVHSIQFKNMEEAPENLNSIDRKSDRKPKAFVEICIKCLKNKVLPTDWFDYEVPLKVQVIYKRFMSLVKKFPTSLIVESSPLRNLILKPRTATLPQIATFSMDNRFEYLGPEHKKVMKHIVTQCLIDEEPVICVLQGPPGCGKTFVMASTIFQLLFVKPECKILLCSLSETVLVEMIRKLHEQMEVTGATFKILGLGIFGDTHKDLQFILENQVKKGFSEQLISLQGHADSNTKDMIRNARVLATTFSYSESSSLELIIKETEMVFDFCIVDEANHCTEIELLQPLTYGVRKLILVGDRKQLQPNIMSKACANIGHFKSFFSRFINAVEEENVLSIWTQYRMHPAISYFPSRMFYNGNISNGTGTDKPLGVRPYIVIDVADRLENIDGMYPLNKPVAYLTARLVEMLATVDDLETIGVITPSHRHKFSVLKELQSRDCSSAKSVQVDIVNGFQGREKHAIVISATRDSKEGIGSFSEPEKLNVALTRAKHCLIICGHMTTLRRNDLWNKLVTDAEKRELFYRVDSYSSPCTLGNVLFGNEGHF